MGIRMCWGYKVGPFWYMDPISKTKAQGHRSFQGWICLEATTGGEVQCRDKFTPDY